MTTFKIGTLHEMMLAAWEAAGKPHGGKGAIWIAIGELFGVDGSTASRADRGYGADAEKTVMPHMFNRFVASLQNDHLFDHPAFDAFKSPLGLRMKLAGTVERDFDTYLAEQRVVQSTGSGTGNLLREEEHDPVQAYLDISVHDVRFFREIQHENGSIEAVIRPGRYIRIANASGKQGAVVLPVDYRTGAIQFVTQHRFPPNTMVTELPRGFADTDDATTSATALRELIEETGQVPIRLRVKNQPVEPLALIPLGDFYANTGVLADKDAFFLAFVDRSKPVGVWKHRKPSLENPVWIGLETAYRAALTLRPAPIKLGPDDRLERQDLFPIKTELDRGRFEIEDGMSYKALMAARPHLCHVFPWLGDVLREIEAEVLSDRVKAQLDAVIAR